MADIYAMRVSGDTLSHLLLLTLGTGAGPMDSPQFFLFCRKIDEKLLLLWMTIYFISHLFSPGGQAGSFHLLRY